MSGRKTRKSKMLVGGKVGEGGSSLGHGGVRRVKRGFGFLLKVTRLGKVKDC